MPLFNVWEEYILRQHLDTSLEGSAASVDLLTCWALLNRWISSKNRTVFLYLKVRLVVDIKITYKPTSEFTEVPRFLERLAKLSDSRVSGAELFERRVTRLCQKPRQSGFPTTVQLIRRHSRTGNTIALPRRTPEYCTFGGFAVRESVPKQRVRSSEMTLAHEIVKGLWSKSLCERYMRPRVSSRLRSFWIRSSHDGLSFRWRGGGRWGMFHPARATHAEYRSDWYILILGNNQSNLTP